MKITDINLKKGTVRLLLCTKTSTRISWYNYHWIFFGLTEHFQVSTHFISITGLLVLRSYFFSPFFLYNSAIENESFD